MNINIHDVLSIEITKEEKSNSNAGIYYIRKILIKGKKENVQVDLFSDNKIEVKE